MHEDPPEIIGAPLLGITQGWKSCALPMTRLKGVLIPESLGGKVLPQWCEIISPGLNIAVLLILFFIFLNFLFYTGVWLIKETQI